MLTPREPRDALEWSSLVGRISPPGVTRMGIRQWAGMTDSGTFPKFVSSNRHGFFCPVRSLIKNNSPIRRIAAPAEADNGDATTLPVAVFHGDARWLSRGHHQP